MFKNNLKGFVIGVALTATVMSPISAFAAAAINATVAKINVVFNGKVVNMENDVVSINGRTYLAVRDVANAVGVDVNWDGATSTVYLGTAPAGLNQQPTAPVAQQPVAQQPQQPSAPVALDMNNPINIARANAPKVTPSFTPAANMKTELTKFSDAIDYLKSTNQFNKETAGNDRVWYYNSFVQPGEKYIPWAKIDDDSLNGYTVVSSFYVDGMSNKKAALELKKDGVVYINENAAKIKYDVDSYGDKAEIQIWNGTKGNIEISYYDRSNNHLITYKYNQVSVTDYIYINGDRFFIASELDAALKTTPEVEDVTEFNNTHKPMY